MDIQQLELRNGLVSESGLPNVMHRPHYHDHIELNVLASGAMHYLLGGSPFSIEAGQMLAFWAAVPHRVTWIAPDTHLHWLYIPLPLALEWNLPAPFMEAVLAGTPLIDSTQPHDLERFQQWNVDLAADQPEMYKVALLEVEARLLRLALQFAQPIFTQHHTAGNISASYRQAQAMARFIARHYPDPITVEDIAQAVNLHPNYAMKIFRDQLNSSILEHLTRHRLAHAQRLLITTDRPVLEIALDAGFGSASRFYAVFRRLCHQTPSQYRRAMRQPR